MDYQHPGITSASTRRFANSREGGIELASKLRTSRGRDDVVVLALPCGGVPAGDAPAERKRVRLSLAGT
jgi:predicted phosphoribosyltransferase